MRWRLRASTSTFHVLPCVCVRKIIKLPGITLRACIHRPAHISCLQQRPILFYCYFRWVPYTENVPWIHYVVVLGRRVVSFDELLFLFRNLSTDARSSRSLKFVCCVFRRRLTRASHGRCLRRQVVRVMRPAMDCSLTDLMRMSSFNELHNSQLGVDLEVRLRTWLVCAHCSLLLLHVFCSCTVGYLSFGPTGIAQCVVHEVTKIIVFSSIPYHRSET